MPTIYEVWNSRSGEFVPPRAGCRFYSPADAMRHVEWRRKRLRVRTFYDRHLKCRVVQFLAGNGWGVR